MYCSVSKCEVTSADRVGLLGDRTFCHSVCLHVVVCSQKMTELSHNFKRLPVQAFEGLGPVKHTLVQHSQHNTET